MTSCHVERGADITEPKAAKDSEASAVVSIIVIGYGVGK